MWPVKSDFTLKSELSKDSDISKHAIAITSLRYSHSLTF